MTSKLSHSVRLLEVGLQTADTVDERIDFAHGLGILKALQELGAAPPEAVTTTYRTLAGR